MESDGEDENGSFWDQAQRDGLWESGRLGLWDEGRVRHPNMKVATLIKKLAEEEMRRRHGQIAFTPEEDDIIRTFAATVPRTAIGDVVADLPARTVMAIIKRMRRMQFPSEPTPGSGRLRTNWSWRGVFERGRVGSVVARDWRRRSPSRL
jgi:hypothetical protein